MISNSNLKEQVLKKIDEFNAADRIGVKLLENSVFVLSGEITEEKINECVKWIIFENLDSKEKILTLYVNSTGGDLYQAFALIDIMQSSKHSVRTIGIGSVMSAAFLIFTSGTKGERYIAANTGIMCHQFAGGGGDAKFHDLKAEMKENELLNQKMVNILKEATGLTPSRIKSKLLPASDVYMTAQEALDLGIADQLL
jgi:ATP-dependent Clp protease protease subunit